MPGTLIGTLVVGAIIGWLASIIARTNDQMGCLWNILIGVVGAALGNLLATKLFNYNIGDDGFSWGGFLVGIAGAVLLILLLRAIGILKKR